MKNTKMLLMLIILLLLTGITGIVIGSVCVSYAGVYEDTGMHLNVFMTDASGLGSNGPYSSHRITLEAVANQGYLMSSESIIQIEGQNYSLFNSISQETWQQNSNEISASISSRSDEIEIGLSIYLMNEETQDTLDLVYTLLVKKSGGSPSELGDITFDIVD